MSRTYRHDDRPRFSRTEAATFRCRRCKLLVGSLPSGGRQRNHCPYCLYSRHLDGRTPGDRASDCGAAMAPIARFIRPNGEHALLHHCLGCAAERHNRVAADNDFDLLLSLPLLHTELC